MMRNYVDLLSYTLSPRKDAKPILSLTVNIRVNLHICVRFSYLNNTHTMKASDPQTTVAA